MISKLYLFSWSSIQTICNPCVCHFIIVFFAEQIVDGVGTAEDNLALKEEEEKQRKARIKKLLPKNGGNHFKNFS